VAVHAINLVDHGGLLNLTNIIQFPTTHTEVLGPYSYDTPITPEFLMHFCEEFEIDSIELFTAIFNHCLEDIEEEMEE
jgi:hypothetical protein